MGIWHTWAVYRRAQVIYGAAIVERKRVKDGVNSGKSDSAHPSRSTTLLSTQEIASPLRIKKQDVTVLGRFIKIKCDKYQGDLAYSLDAIEGGGVALKFIPQRTDPERTLSKIQAPRPHPA